MFTKQIEESIFRACQSVFKGDAAKIRNRQKILRLLNSDWPALKLRMGLKKKQKLKPVVGLVHSFAAQGLFDGGRKKRGPTGAVIHESTPSHLDESTTVLPESNLANIITNKALCKSNGNVDGGGNVNNNKKVKSNGDVKNTNAPTSNFFTANTAEMLPLEITNRVLSVAQDILEQSAHKWTKEKLPMLIDRMRWETALHLELDVWVKNMATTAHEEFRTVIDTGRLKAMCPVIANIRNAAVHRNNPDLTTIAKMMRTAAELAEMLGEPDEYFRKIQSRLELVREGMDSSTGTIRDGQKGRDSTLDEIKSYMRKMQDARRKAFERHKNVLLEFAKDIKCDYSQVDPATVTPFFDANLEADGTVKAKLKKKIKPKSPPKTK